MGLQVLGDQQPALPHQQSVAIRRGFRHKIARDQAGCASAVFNHHRLAQQACQARGQQACHGINPTAGREAHEQADGLDGIGLGLRGAAGQADEADQQQDTAANLAIKKFHWGSPVVVGRSAYPGPTGAWASCLARAAREGPPGEFCNAITVRREAQPGHFWQAEHTVLGLGQPVKHQLAALYCKRVVLHQ